MKKRFYLLTTNKTCEEIEKHFNQKNIDLKFVKEEHLNLEKFQNQYLIFNFNPFKNVKFLKQLELVNLQFNFKKLKIEKIELIGVENSINLLEEKIKQENFFKEEIIYKPQKALWKEILTTYNKVVFFDNFNTFKYALKKEFRNKLEIELKNYCLADKNNLIGLLNNIFDKMTSNQKFKYDIPYYSILNYIEKGYLQKLKECLFKNTEEVFKELEESKLDYFDLGFLKAFLTKAS